MLSHGSCPRVGGHSLVQELAVTRPSISKLDIDDTSFRSLEFFLQLVDSALHLVHLDSEHIWDTGDNIPTFYNLIHLEIDRFAYTDWTIVSLLQGFPKLQSLIIHKYGDYDLDGEGLMDFSTPDDVPPCISSHLEEFAPFGFEGSELEFEIVKFIMENATVLRDDGTYEREDFEMVKELLSSSPRCSANCRFICDIFGKSNEEVMRDFLTNYKVINCSNSKLSM